MKYTERTYPEWFIDEIVNEEDKAKAKDGSLKSNETIEFKCTKNHCYKQKVSNHIRLFDQERLKGCPICSKEEQHKKFSLTIYLRRNYPEWFINELVDEEDRKRALSGELSGEEKVKFKCNKEHTYIQRVRNHIEISSGSKRCSCPLCGKIKMERSKEATVSRKRTYPEWFIDELVNEDDKEKARNGSLMNKSIVEFKCEDDHTYKQLVYNHIKVSTKERKQGCPICGKEKKTENRMKTISSKRVYPKWFIDELVNEEDKEKAKNGSLRNTTIVEFKCHKGHIYKQKVYSHIKISSLGRRNGCPYCNYYRSKPEIELEEYIRSLNYNTDHKRFVDSFGKTFEIDIFISSRNIGIEYSGSYYHSVNNGIRNITNLYHYNKFNECQKKNILLVTIFDTEWNNKKEEIKQYIKDILDGKENELSYDKEGYMNNNYPSWKNYQLVNELDYFEDLYTYQNKYKVYTCGYSLLKNKFL